VFREGAAIGQGFGGAGPLIHVGEHPQGADILGIQAISRAGGLVCVNQSAPLHRLFGAAHQLVGAPALEGAVGGQGGKAEKGKNDQQEKTQG